MQTISVKIEVTKETKEVVDFLSVVIDKIREMKGKSNTEKIAALTQLLPAGIVAVEGADQLDEEAKSKNLDDNIAYFTKELLERVVPSARGSEISSGDL